MLKIKGFQDTIEWYNKNAQKYAQVSAENANLEQIYEFISSLPLHGKILDAGCGSGRDTNIFSQKEFKVIGVDLSHGLIKEAKKQFPESEFLQGNILSLPFEKNTFDGVWAHASLVHLETVEEVKKSLNEFHRVLKKDGVLHVLVKAQSGKEKTAIVSDKFSQHDRFFQYFTQSELINLLKEAKFTIKKVEQYVETDKHPNGRPEVKWILALGTAE